VLLLLLLTRSADAGKVANIYHGDWQLDQPFLIEGNE